MSLLDDLQALKLKSQEASRKRAKIEADRDNIRAQRQTALETLKDKFGVSSIEEGRQLLKKWKVELDERIEKLRREIGGGD